jgi:hypothetical protein
MTMKKTITTLCLVGSGLIILSSLDLIRTLTLFFLAGIIPGTNIAVTPIDMMSASATAITIVILRITVWPRLAKAFFLEPPVVKKKRASRARRATV